MLSFQCTGASRSIATRVSSTCRENGWELKLTSIFYALRHARDCHVEPSETFTLATTLLDPIAAPSRELAELYGNRWEIESAFGAFKSQLKGDGVVLRSKTPDGVQQELWALLCAYHAIRELICAAAAMTKADPLRISFLNAADAVRAPIGDPTAFFPSQQL